MPEFIILDVNKFRISAFIRMMLESIEASMSVDIEELRANEDWRGDVTRKQQEDETPQEDARRKRHFIVSTMKLQTDSRIFQMTRAGKATQPKAPNPDAQWSKRQWEKAMATWRSELRQWVDMQNATKKQHWRPTPSQTPHTKIAWLSVSLNPRNAKALCPKLDPGGLRTQHCNGSEGR